MVPDTLDVRKYASLIKIVFGSNEGQQLLKQLEIDTALVFDKNTNVMYTRVGEHGLVQGFKNILNLSESDIKEMEEQNNSELIDDSFLD